MKKITPFLWFDDQAEQAARFYVSIFKKSKVTSVSGSSVTFTLEGVDFLALNGGPHYKLTPAISLYVDCKTQKEVDVLWRKLSSGGTLLRCGWLTDKYGLTWQIIPSVLGKLLGDKNPKKAGSVMKAMMQMVKLDIEKLQQAYDRG